MTFVITGRPTPCPGHQGDIDIYRATGSGPTLRRVSHRHPPVVAGPGERRQAGEGGTGERRDDDRRGQGRATADGAAVRARYKLAFARLVRRHEHELRAHCLRIVGSVAEAEDMVQETFLRAWRNRASFEGRSGVRTWLYRIATNACVDALRRRSHPVGRAVAGRRARRRRRPGGTRAARAQDHEPGEAVAARETIEQAMLSIIDLLPARQRAVLILRDVYGWTAGASASHLDTTVAAANSASSGRGPPCEPTGRTARPPAPARGGPHRPPARRDPLPGRRPRAVRRCRRPRWPWPRADHGATHSAGGGASLAGWPP